jgi:1,4-dihydroxy-2-naphthoate octaprenyltransferase
MATTTQWLAATRPRTLPAAIAPVVVGWAAAWHDAHDLGLSHTVAILAMLVALALQVGVNYSNDYSDGIRGTDEVRVGPVRLVGQKLAAATQVKTAAFAMFALAAVAGLGIVAITGERQMIVVGALAILSAWFYTGGKNPYGYVGLGELFVFVWFGLVAVQGTVFVLLGRTTALGWLFGVGAGALSCALLVANNLRDVPTDTVSGKRTLAVRLGASKSRWLYIGLIWTALLAPFIAIAGGSTRWLALTLLAAASAHKPGWAVIRGASGRDLLPVLAATGRTLLVWAATISLGLWVGTRF